MRKFTENDIGTRLGTSAWTTISQEEIDGFGRVTRDEAPLHMDPRWAQENAPFGGTIAYGFQTLSLLAHFTHEILDWPTDDTSEGIALNYGFDRVRFMSPVPVNTPIRCHLMLKGFETTNAGHPLTRFLIEVEVEGIEKPALVADWLAVIGFDNGEAGADAARSNA